MHAGFCQAIGRTEMFWSIGQFPEFDHLEPIHRAQVLARIPWWTYPVIVARAILPAMLLGAIGGVFVAPSLWSVAAAIIGVPMALIIATFLYLSQLSRLRVIMRRVISEAFKDGRPPFCFECGYNLRASAAARCPECGRSIRGEVAA
jgi:hypothetical protein